MTHICGNERPGPIVVTGATGRQGAAVVHALRRDGWSVRAMTRRPESRSADRLRELGATLVRGDFDEPRSLVAALDDAYGVFGVQDFWEAGYHGEVRQGKALVDSARRVGVSHFIYASVGAAERTSGLGITHFESKWQIEQYLERSGVPHTVLRPVTFFENFTTPRYVKSLVDKGLLRFIFPNDIPFQMVAAADIGDFVALALADPNRFIGQKIEIASDEVTMLEFARTLSQVLDRPVAYREISMAWMGPVLHLIGLTGQSKRYRVGPSIAAHARWSRGQPGGGWAADIDSLRALHPGLIRTRDWAGSVDWRGLRAQLR